MKKKNYRTNGNEWIRCVKIIECVNLWCKLLIFCSLYLSILSVNDAKTRLKKASRMSLFYLLSYYDTDKSEINIESIFKNCPGFRNLLKKSQLFYRQTSRQLYEDSFLSENIAWKLLKMSLLPPIFFLVKMTCLVTLFDRKLQVFKTR